MMARSQASKTGSFLFALALGALVLAVLFGTNLRVYVLETVVGLLSRSTLGSPYAHLGRAELEARLTDAETELARTRYQAALYTLLSDENRELRRAASVESFSSAIPARVVARPPRTHYDTLLIDAGSSQGVSENDIVVHEGVLLGKVVSVSGTAAVVELFSSPKATQDAILGSPSAVAVAEGRGGGAFEITIPRDVEVAAGDVVRASYSETLLLGIVAAVSGDPNDATKVVYAASPVSMNELDFVSVIPQKL